MDRGGWRLGKEKGIWGGRWATRIVEWLFCRLMCLGERGNICIVPETDTKTETEIRIRTELVLGLRPASDRVVPNKNFP